MEENTDKDVIVIGPSADFEEKINEAVNKGYEIKGCGGGKATPGDWVTKFCVLQKEKSEKKSEEVI